MANLDEAFKTSVDHMMDRWKTEPRKTTYETSYDTYMSYLWRSRILCYE